MKKTILLLSSVFALIFSSYAQSEEINGQILDSITGKGIYNATVAIYNGHNLITGNVTDFSGSYTIKPIDAGEYRMVVSYLGYDSIIVNHIVVHQDAITTVDLAMSANSQLMHVANVVDYKNPMTEKGIVTTGGYVDAKTLKDMPVAHINEALAIVAPMVYQSDDNKDIQIGGGRVGTTAYYIDGVKMDGTPNVPMNGIQDMKVITGGLPAKYGDLTGGVVLITTKSYFSVSK